MALQVIAAGLGRNATLSMKFALEALGFGPCHHMTVAFANERKQAPLWLEAAAGRPDWDAIFSGFSSTSDYPSATFWREIADYYPTAKVVLTTRDPDRWFDSVSETIFSPWMQDAHVGTASHALMRATMFDPIGGDVSDRAFLTKWYVRRNQAVLDGIAAERLLHFDVRDGWQPLCEFLDAAVPDLPFPRTNSRAQLGRASGAQGLVASDPQARERFARLYIEIMRDQAFAARD
ncbi:MAG: sulfotransferase family protein [Croceibacterium sp.]